MTKISDLHRRWSKDPDYKAAYDALGEEFDLEKLRRDYEHFKKYTLYVDLEKKKLDVLKQEGEKKKQELKFAADLAEKNGAIRKAEREASKAKDKLGSLTKDLAKNRITYPGPLDTVHEWAYLPDYVDALVRLARIRTTLGEFETFGFSGHAVTGQELVSTMAKVAGRQFKVGKINWLMMRTIGSLWNMGRELSDIGYLWRVPHRIDGSKLVAAIGPVPHTPLDRAVTKSLRELGAIA